VRSACMVIFFPAKKCNKAIGLLWRQRRTAMAGESIIQYLDKSTKPAIGTWLRA